MPTDRTTDVAEQRASQACECRYVATSYDGDYVTRDADCYQHGSGSEIRRFHGLALCECGAEELVAQMLTVTWAGGSMRLCRTCSTCARCGDRAEVVDGDRCERCAITEDAERGRGELEAEWATVYRPTEPR